MKTYPQKSTPRENWAVTSEQLEARSEERSSSVTVASQPMVQNFMRPLEGENIPMKYGGGISRGGISDIRPGRDKVTWIFFLTLSRVVWVYPI